MDLVECHRGRPIYFIMDNLNAHKNTIVINVIIGDEHQVVYCVDYWTTDGLIEFLSNTLHA